MDVLLAEGGLTKSSSWPSRTLELAGCEDARMSDTVNIFDPGPWDRDLGPARGSRLGSRAGAAGDYLQLTRDALEAEPNR